MPQFDLSTDERTCTDRAVQWERWSHEFETMSRETLLDVVKDAIITERSPSAIRTHLLVNAQTLTRYATVRAAIEAFLAVSPKCGPEHSGRPPVDAMTRKGKGSTDKKQGNSKGKDTENEKGERVEGYCGHCGNGGTDKRFVCLSRHVYSAETDTEEIQDVDPKSKQTPVPVAALRRISTTGLPDEQRNDGIIRTIPSQFAHLARIWRTDRVFRTTMLLSAGAVHTADLECRLDRPVELSHA